MLHLLPEQQKRLVTIEYHKRLGITIGLFVICLAVGGLALLLPSYIVAYGRYAKVNESKKQIEDQLSRVSVNTNKDVLKEVSDRLSALAPLGAPENASLVFDRYGNIKATGIRTTRMSYQLNKDKTVALQVDGVATNREVLLAFADAINDSGYFTGAKVPLASLRINRNVTFNFKLKVVPGLGTSTSPIMKK